MPASTQPPLALLGRSTELSVFHDAYAAARAGRPTMLRLTGESGIGKTALLGEFLHELRSAADVVILHGRCYERESVPYKAFDRVVDELTRYLRRLREVEVASLLPRDAAALLRIFPVLGRVDLVATFPARAAADDQERRRYAFDAFAELLAKIRDRHMLVLCIDDLQWLDHDSLLLLEHLLSQNELSPLLFIASYHAPERTSDGLLPRVDHAARANPRLDVRAVTLGPLSFEASCELASRLLGAGCADELVAAVAEEALGSPFLLGEVARHVVELGAKAALDRLSLQQVVRGRAKRLGHIASRMLELLAISGRPTPVSVLARAVDANSDADARHALDLLCTAQLVRESGARTYDLLPRSDPRSDLRAPRSRNRARVPRTACGRVVRTQRSGSRNLVRALPGRGATRRSRPARDRGRNARRFGSCVRAQRSVSRPSDRVDAARRSRTPETPRAARRRVVARGSLVGGSAGVRGGERPER